MARIGGISGNPLFGFQTRTEDRGWQLAQRAEQQRQIDEKRALDRAMGQAATIMAEPAQFEETPLPAQPQPPQPSPGDVFTGRAPETRQAQEGGPSWQQQPAQQVIAENAAADAPRMQRRQKNTASDKMARITALLANTPGAGLTAFKAADASEEQQRKMDRDVIDLMGKADPKTVAWYIKQNGQEDRYGDLLQNPSAMSVVSQTARTMAQMGIKGDDALNAVGAMMEAMSKGMPYQQAFQQALVQASQSAANRPEGAPLIADQGIYQRTRGGAYQPVEVGGERLTRTPTQAIQAFATGAKGGTPYGGVQAQRDQMRIDILSKHMPRDQAEMIVAGRMPMYLTPAQRATMAQSIFKDRDLTSNMTIQDALREVDTLFPQQGSQSPVPGAATPPAAPSNDPLNMRRFIK